MIEGWTEEDSRRDNTFAVAIVAFVLGVAATVGIVLLYGHCLKCL